MVDRSNPNFLRNKYYFYESTLIEFDSLSKLRGISKDRQTYEDVASAIEQYDCRFLPILKYASKKRLTRELCEKAVSVNGENLLHVPKRFQDDSMLELAFTDKYKNDLWYQIPKDKYSKELFIKIASNNFKVLDFLPIEYHCYEVYKAAIENDYIGEALGFVEFEQLSKEESLELCKTAVGNNGVAIKYVPSEFIDYDLVKLAVENSIDLEQALNLDFKMDHRFYFPIELVPAKYVSKDLALISIKADPSSISVLCDYIDKDFCNELVMTDYNLIKYIPEQYVDMDMVTNAICKNPYIFKALPERFKTNEVFNLLDATQQICLIEYMPDEIPDNWSSTKVLIDTNIDDAHAFNNCENKQSRDLAKVADSYSIVKDPDSNEKHTFGYVSDIHLEYQLDLFGKDPITCVKLVKEFAELVKNQIHPKLEALFVLGDVSSNAILTNIFFRSLKQYNRVQLVSVLGNHELWRKDLDSSFSVDDIVQDYKENVKFKYINRSYVFILENELLVRTSSDYSKVISEEQILKYEDSELREILLEAKYVVLGGTGFAGCNPKYNADYGLYHSRVSRQEELELTKRFNSVYEKVLRCADDIRVIVATHMNHSDWYKGDCNENWLYLSGHTHQNHCEFSNGKPLVLADNQLGYKQRNLKIKKFILESNYHECIESYEDGIYEISLNSYLSFYQKLNINIEGVYAGDIVMLKRDGLYMFLLKDKNKTYLLKGGKRYSLNNQDEHYYYDNMLRYEKKVKEFFSGYRQALCKISNEIKSIGGDGRIHGSIVDIDYFNHVYLNPLDGIIAYYYASDIVDKTFFSSFRALLDESPLCLDDKLLKSNYMKLNGDKDFNYINRGFTSLEIAHSRCIKYESTAMYSVSRVILDYQYIFDNRIIRVWNDKLLNYEQGDNSNILALSE